LERDARWPSGYFPCLVRHVESMDVCIELHTLHTWISLLVKNKVSICLENKVLWKGDSYLLYIKGKDRVYSLFRYIESKIISKKNWNCCILYEWTIREIKKATLIFPAVEQAQFSSHLLFYPILVLLSVTTSSLTMNCYILDFILIFNIFISV
jgi:hypothetical protein